MGDCGGDSGGGGCDFGGGGGGGGGYHIHHVSNHYSGGGGTSGGGGGRGGGGGGRRPQGANGMHEYEPEEYIFDDDNGNDDNFDSDDEHTSAKPTWSSLCCSPSLLNKRKAQRSQLDGGKLQCCLIRIDWGIIPGKLSQHQARYSLWRYESMVPAERENVKPLGGALHPEGSERPNEAHGWELLGDKRGHSREVRIAHNLRRRVWAAVAINTPHGNVPAKVLPDGRCFYAHENVQYLAKEYRYVEN